MIENRTRMWKHSMMWVMLTLLFTLSIRLFFVIHYGTLNGGDTEFYIGNAESILQSGIRWYYDNISIIWYWGYPTFLAAVFTAIGKNYFAVVIIQTILVSFACVLIYMTMVKLGITEVVACILTIFYSINNDVIMWDRFILSDCMGMFWEILCLYFFYNILLNKWSHQTWNLKSIVVWIVTGIFFLLTRTNAISLILGMLVVIIFQIEDKRIRRIFLGGVLR